MLHKTLNVVTVKPHQNLFSGVCPVRGQRDKTNKHGPVAVLLRVQIYSDGVAKSCNRSVVTKIKS